MRNRVRSGLLVAAAGLLVLAQGTAAAGEQAKEYTPNVRFVTVGGLLGQLDGFCEPPGGAYDLTLEPLTQPPRASGQKPAAPQLCPPVSARDLESASTTQAKWPAPLGGLIGVHHWLASIKTPKGDTKGPQLPIRLLVHGNNMPPDFADYLATDASYNPSFQLRPTMATDLQRTEQVRQGRLFWTALDQLNPDVVALGPDDFYRGLRLSSELKADLVEAPASSPASRLVAWVKDTLPNIPLLASNVVITARAKALNTLTSSDKRYALEIGEQVSSGWIGELVVRHPCNEPHTFRLDVASKADLSDAIEVPLRVVPPATPDDCRTTVAPVTGALRPGAFFRLSYVDAHAATPGTLVEIATFRTHEALTPANDPAAGLEGWPVLLRRLDDNPIKPVSTSDEMMIVSLISTEAREVLGTASWQWTVRKQTPAAVSTGKPAADSICTARDHELTCALDIVPPVVALEQILGKVLHARGRLPFIVLLSSMTDEDTTAVLEAFPEIRLVVLQPESFLLGGAARETPVGAKPGSLAAKLAEMTLPSSPAVFSGDLGMLGVLDRHVPAITRVLVRPEWVGETGGDLPAYVARGGTGDTSQWLLRPAPEAQVKAIPGIALQAIARQTAGGLRVVYTPHRLDGPNPDPDAAEPPQYDPYLTCEADDKRPICEAYRSIWRKAPTMLAVAGDALIERAYADLAIVPDDLVDAAAISWIAGAIEGSNTFWLSRYILQRVVFRSYRFVRAIVAGDKLVGVLQKILDDPLGNGSTYCIVGLGVDTGCPSKIDPNRTHRLRIAGRVIVPGMYYSIAMPDRLAEHEGLTHDDDSGDVLDALDALHTHLAGADGKTWYRRHWATTGAAPNLVARIEDEAIARRRSFINLSTFEVGWSGIDADAPGDADTIPNNVDIESRGVKSEEAFSIAWKLDASLVDMKRQAARLLFDLEYTRRRFHDDELISYDRDRLLFGGRFDIWKARRFGDLRPYVGGFFEGPTRRHVSALTASRQVGTRGSDEAGAFKSSETAGFPNDYVVERNVYRYFAAGADMLVHLSAKPIPRVELTLTRARLEFNRGIAGRVPIDLQVKAQSDAKDGLTLTDIRAVCPDATGRIGDAKALLNAYFTCFSDGLTKETVVTVETDDRRQDRTQLEGEGSVSFPVWSDKVLKLTLNTLHRFYDVSGGSTELAIRRTWRFKTQLAMPLWWRLEFAPTYEYQRAFIQAATDNRFAVHRWEIKVKAPLYFRIGRRPFGQ